MELHRISCLIIAVLPRVLNIRWGQSVKLQARNELGGNHCLYTSGMGGTVNFSREKCALLCRITWARLAGVQPSMERKERLHWVQESSIKNGQRTVSLPDFSVIPCVVETRFVGVLWVSSVRSGDSAMREIGLLVNVGAGLGVTDSWEDTSWLSHWTPTISSAICAKPSSASVCLSLSSCNASPLVPGRLEVEARALVSE